LVAESVECRPRRFAALRDAQPRGPLEPVAEAAPAPAPPVPKPGEPNYPIKSPAFRAAALAARPAKKPGLARGATCACFTRGNASGASAPAARDQSDCFDAPRPFQQRAASSTSLAEVRRASRT
jgi:hypothetical protein